MNPSGNTRDKGQGATRVDRRSLIGLGLTTQLAAFLPTGLEARPDRSAAEGPAEAHERLLDQLLAAPYPRERRIGHHGLGLLSEVAAAGASAVNGPNGKRREVEVIVWGSQDPALYNFAIRHRYFWGAAMGVRRDAGLPSRHTEWVGVLDRIIPPVTDLLAGRWAPVFGGPAWLTLSVHLADQVVALPRSVALTSRAIAFDSAGGSSLRVGAPSAAERATLAVDRVGPDLYDMIVEADSV